MSSKITDLNSDKELILQIRTGDKNAFKTLFIKYYRKLINFCLYRSVDLETAKDLVQEIFTKLWNSKSHLDPEKSIQAYLYKSITNQTINLAKHSSSKNISLDISIFAKSANNEQSIDDKIDIETSIEKLPEKLKTVFLLSRIEGFKYSEIAEICNISVKAVEKRMSKAFLLLRKYLN
jgi:RNA polymerase sigma-70 factor (ECF subfamily)